MTSHRAAVHDRRVNAGRTEGARRCRGDRGTGMVTGLVLMFAFTAGGVVWLARDVDRGIANRSVAQSVAFQAARSGAQQMDVVAIRSGDPGAPVDPDRARAAALATADAALAAAGARGRVTDVSVGRDRVTVHVEVHDPTRTVTGAATVRSADRP